MKMQNNLMPTTSLQYRLFQVLVLPLPCGFIHEIYCIFVT
jgi:hypothetical protein